MFLFEYIIKLLMGNSDALFMGLLIVVFGYYGWLLWNINNSYKKFFNSWDRHNEDYVETREIIFELERKLTRLENLTPRLETLNRDIDKSSKDILKEIDEESEEIKEIIKILLGHYRKMESNNFDKLKKK